MRVEFTPRALAVLLALAALPALAGAQQPNVEAAKKEGRVVAYGTILPQIMGPLHAAFEKKYGIKVDYWRASATQVLERAQNEHAAGRPGFDVTFAAQGAQLLLKQTGALTKYSAPAAEKFPARFRDKDGVLTAWRHTPVSVLYNTEMVRPAEAPKSLEDMLLPKWKGKIGIPDPSRHSTTLQFLISLKKVIGDGWLNYVKALAKQQPLLRESFAPVPNDILRGEVQLGFTYIQYVTQMSKAPLGFMLTDKILTDTNELGLGAKAANANAARLYIDYLCSPEAQKIAAELGEFVLSPGIHPSIKDADKIAAASIFMDDPGPEEFKRLSAEFRQIFLGQ